MPPPVCPLAPQRAPRSTGLGLVHGHCRAGGAWHPPPNPGATALRSGLQRHVSLFPLESMGDLFQLPFLKRSEMFPPSDRGAGVSMAQERLPRPGAHSVCSRSRSSTAAAGHPRAVEPMELRHRLTPFDPC